MIEKSQDVSACRKVLVKSSWFTVQWLLYKSLGIMKAELVGFWIAFCHDHQQLWWCLILPFFEKHFRAIGRQDALANCKTQLRYNPAIYGIAAWTYLEVYLTPGAFFEHCDLTTPGLRSFDKMCQIHCLLKAGDNDATGDSPYLRRPAGKWKMRSLQNFFLGSSMWRHVVQRKCFISIKVHGKTLIQQRICRTKHEIEKQFSIKFFSPPLKW